MIDSAVMPDETEGSAEDIPVGMSTLEIEGVQPEQGDSVNLKVVGTVSKIVNGTAFVTPVTVNGEPITAEKPDATEDDFMAAAQQQDAAMGYGG